MAAKEKIPNHMVPIGRPMQRVLDRIKTLERKRAKITRRAQKQMKKIERDLVVKVAPINDEIDDINEAHRDANNHPPEAEINTVARAVVIEYRVELADKLMDLPEDLPECVGLDGETGEIEETDKTENPE